MKAFALFLLAAPILGAQHIGYGIKAGVPFTDVFASSSIGTLAETGRFAIGPMLELRLPLVGIEADLLYHHDSYTLQQSAGSTKASGSSWQFPITGKLHTPALPIVKPYAEAGIAFRGFTGGTELKNESKKGFVLGAGLDIHVLLLHIAPELRYTRWGSGAPSTLQANQNQFEFLVGFSR